jgi:hypothetical protein
MATTTTTINVTTQKADIVLELQALIHGVNTLIPNVDPFLLARKTVSRAAFLSQAQARLDAALKTKDARIALHNAVEAERNAQADFKPTRSAFRAYLVSYYGANAPELQQYGFVQNRRPKKTAQAKANAATKAKATRTAQGTKGKKQKAAIKATPPTASSTAQPAVATAPVPAAPPPSPAIPPSVTPAHVA